MVPLLLLLNGCLEHTTGEAVPLDCRFYGCKEEGSGVGPDGGSGGPESGGEGPWASVTGEKRKINGMIVSPEDLDVQVDVNEPDAASPGGQKRVGALHVPTGSFELEVPVSVTKFRIEAFQDPDADGPTANDPYAEAMVDLSNGVPMELRLELVVGARNMGGQPTPAPPGAPGGPGGSGGPGGNGGPAAPPDPFGDAPRVALSGTVSAANTAVPVVVDLFKVDPSAPGGRTFMTRVEAASGAYTFQVPKDYGAIELEAYQDLDKDGPSATDPKGRLNGPVTIAAEDVGGVAITVQ